MFKSFQEKNWCSGFSQKGTGVKVFFGKRTDVFFFKEPMFKFLLGKELVFKFLLEKELVFMFFWGNRTGGQVSFERNWRSSSLGKKNLCSGSFGKKCIFKKLYREKEKKKVSFVPIGFYCFFITNKVMPPMLLKLCMVRHSKCFASGMYGCVDLSYSIRSMSSAMR